MSATEGPPAPTEKPGCMVRAFIIVLPLGLAFMVPLSLWIYYQKKHQPEAATSQYAAMLTKMRSEEGKGLGLGRRRRGGIVARRPRGAGACVP